MDIVNNKINLWMLSMLKRAFTGQTNFERKNSHVKPLGLILDILYFYVNNDIKVYALC